jgi:hypothetical protein
MEPKKHWDAVNKHERETALKGYAGKKCPKCGRSKWRTHMDGNREKPAPECANLDCLHRPEG